MRFFTKDELKCPCCGLYKIENKLINRLERLRFKMGRPLKINSAMRCDEHNYNVGGARQSQHLLGLAADVSMLGMTAEQKYKMVEWAVLLGFKGIGISDSYIHVDMREGERCLWVY